MRSCFGILILTLLACGAASAQSGRQRPTPTPTPKQIGGPSAIYSPAPLPGKPPKPGPWRRPTPTPTPTPVSSEEIIKVESTLVPIPVSVSDGDGRPVTTLKLENFDLKVDGKPAEISELIRAESPIRLAMLFDNSSSVSLIREFEKEAAIRFLKRVIRPTRDKAALFSVADYTRLEQPLTADIRTLIHAIEMFPVLKGATALLDGILKTAEYMKSVEGRRVLIIVSDGEDTYSDLTTSLEQVVSTLLSTDLQVYVVSTKDFENYKRTGERRGNANLKTLTAEHRMNEIAGQTGGAVYSPITEDEMSAAFTQIAADLSQQYILSYYPDSEADKKRKGELRTISVGVKGKPLMQVRTRKGYIVPIR